MIVAEHTQSLTAFRESMAETFDRLHVTREAEIVTVNGEARAVLLSPAAYDELAREAQAAAIRRAMDQHNRGESRELHAAMDDIRAELLAMKAVQAAARTLLNE